MKRVWLTLCAVTVFVSACTTETFPVLIPTAEELIVQNPGAAAERAALVALYEATDGANWLSDRPLGAWHGVTTDSAGRVTSLVLTGNRLSGEIPPELGDLTDLTQLHLEVNELSGSIPPELGNLTNLTSLDLRFNRLSGEIPSELGNLARLNVLALASNRLSGEIPSELGNLTNLTSLDLSSNQLTGPVPALNNLTSLSWLNLRGNLLCLPEGAVQSGPNGVAAAHLRSLDLPACAGAQRPQSPATAEG